MWILTIRSPDGKPRKYKVENRKTKLGRRDDNDIVVSDLSASRLHAEIELEELKDDLILRDLGSTNGTYVNRERLNQPRRLEPNDVIRIGEVVIYVSRLVTGDRSDPTAAGTHPLTRDVVLESIDQQAVLMYEISKKLNTVMDIETALKEVSDMMRMTLGAEKCVVLLADQFDRLSELGFPTTIAQNVVQKKSAIIIPKVAASDERFGKSAYLYRIRSVICVPILSGDELLGLIYAYKVDPTEPAFDKRDFQLAVAISHQAALTIQRMRLLEKVREEQLMRQLLQRFISPIESEFVTKQLVYTDHLPELEERKVTVLFADISDSTGLAERLGANNFGKILSRYYQEMTDAIFTFGGMVDKFLGDGIMAVFGMTSNIDDPEARAVKAGLKMLDIIDRMNGEIEVKISIGVGINTGMVVAGYVGTKQQVELTVLGDTVNVAAGLQNLARPNRLFVGPATVAAVVGQFDTQRVGAIVVKGRTRDIQAYEVLRTHTEVQ